MSMCYLLDGEMPPARKNGKRLPCERLYAEKEELQAENAHLQESVQNAEYEESVAWDMVHSSERRNDKLRELVKAAWRCIHTGIGCSDCRLTAGGCTLKTAMRELGIEADE